MTFTIFSIKNEYKSKGISSLMVKQQFVELSNFGSTPKLYPIILYFKYRISKLCYKNEK